MNEVFELEGTVYKKLSKMRVDKYVVGDLIGTSFDGQPLGVITKSEARGTNLSYPGWVLQWKSLDGYDEVTDWDGPVDCTDFRWVPTQHVFDEVPA